MNLNSHVIKQMKNVLSNKDLLPSLKFVKIFGSERHFGGVMSRDLEEQLNDFEEAMKRRGVRVFRN